MYVIGFEIVVVSEPCFVPPSGAVAVATFVIVVPLLTLPSTRTSTVRVRGELEETVILLQVIVEPLMVPPSDGEGETRPDGRVSVTVSVIGFEDVLVSVIE